jgi:hypothetical protein
MERLCREIASWHEQRQTLLTTLKSGALQLKEDTSQRLQGFRKQSVTLRGDLQAARKAWQKAAAVLAKKRQHARRGVE